MGYERLLVGNTPSCVGDEIFIEPIQGYAAAIHPAHGTHRELIRKRVQIDETAGVVATTPKLDASNFMDVTELAIQTPSINRESALGSGCLSKVSYEKSRPPAMGYIRILLHTGLVLTATELHAELDPTTESIRPKRISLNGVAKMSYACATLATSPCHSRTMRKLARLILQLVTALSNTKSD